RKNKGKESIIFSLESSFQIRSKALNFDLDFAQELGLATANAMRFLRRIAGIFGLARDEDHDAQDHREAELEEDETAADQCIPPHQSRHRSDFHETGQPHRGFSVPVQVSVGPVLLPCKAGDGGVQGLRWYARLLKVDEDGDVADEFLDETVSSDMSRFETKSSTRRAKVKRQIMSRDGKFQHCVEYQGRLLWI
ncbi:hypothetical protein LINGRAHAP2_LOCUS3702, partial [Linum grandiflorum]